MSSDPESDRPRILSRRTVFESPFMALVERRVALPWDVTEQVFHDVALPDYVAMVAFTADGRIPVVRQFRPAVEQYVWELPAGTRDPGETPEQTCRRELREETGLASHRVRGLGRFFADTGRLANAVHLFAVAAGDPDPAFACEPGMGLEFVTCERLLAMIADGEFALVSHVAAVLLAIRQPAPDAPG